MALLWTGLERAKRGIGASFLITGAPGVGKSRLALEFASQAAAGGSIAIRVVASSAREADKCLVLPSSESAAANITGPSLQSEPAESLDAANLGIFEPVARTLWKTQAVAPVVTFDDLQDLDSEGLNALPSLLHTLARFSPMVIGIYRSVDLNLRKDLAKLLRGPFFKESVRINLRDFTSDEVYELVRSRVNTRLTSSALESVVTATGGNPRMLDNAVNLGLLEEPSILPRVQRGLELEIQPHIELLSEPARQMMSVAAAIGLEFDLSVLARVAEMPVDQLLDGLREGEIGGLISHNKKPGRFVFQHALIRDGLHESLSGAERARLHRRIGEAFERSLVATTSPCWLISLSTFTKAHCSQEITKPPNTACERLSKPLWSAISPNQSACARWH